MKILKNWIANLIGENNIQLEQESFKSLVDQLEDNQQLIIFKYSSRCYVSIGVEKVFDEWYAEMKNNNLKLVKVNVIESRPLSMKIAEVYGMRHESPQLIWVKADDSVLWHGSHHEINKDNLNNVLNCE